jgi:hypothetical protein
LVTTRRSVAVLDKEVGGKGATRVGALGRIRGDARVRHQKRQPETQKHCLAEPFHLILLGGIRLAMEVLCGSQKNAV